MTKTISNYLLDNWQLLSGYFAEAKMDKWENDYRKKAEDIGHDEPWLTLIATRAMMGGKEDLSEQKRVDALNALLRESGMENPPALDMILDIQLEKQLPEILSYREILKSKAFHYYPESIRTIEEKKNKVNASFEGPTHVDLVIIGRTGERNICFVIEAKFNSDISKDISYNPVRDQIIRNIDAAIDYQYDKDQKIRIDDFYFLLLTPKVFRTDRFGGNRKTSIDIFQPQRSRLYCYKMDDYKVPENIKKALPHRWEFDKETWSRIANHIGWITFEDMYRFAIEHETILQGEEKMIREFLERRNMIEI